MANISAKGGDHGRGGMKHLEKSYRERDGDRDRDRD